MLGRSTVVPVEAALVLAGGIWLLLGLFIDGYAHSEIIDTETEDFFTPWHALFYSGFAFTTAVMGWIAIRRLEPGRPVLAGAWEALPVGYRGAAVGLGVFAIGGIGDGIWHTIYGVETSIDALLSPTHLVLLSGLLLILSTPLRAAWLDPAPRSGWGPLAGPVVATTLVTSLCAFFFTYAFGLTDNWQMTIPYFPRTDENGEFVAYGLASTYLATTTLIVPTIALLRRWRLPPGAIVVLWTVPVALTAAAFDGVIDGIPAAAVGAVVVELVLAALSRPLPRWAAAVIALGVGTTVMWSVFTALSAWTNGVVWQAELWSGQIMMNGGIAVGLALVAFVPAGPPPQEPARGAHAVDSAGVGD